MKNVLLIISLMGLLQSQAQDTTTIEYADVYYKGSWRIIDRQGNFILNLPNNMGLNPGICFSDAMAVTVKKRKFGYIDFKNNRVIPNQFDGAHCFEFGYAAVSVGEKWGFINKEGKFIVDPVYDYAGNFGPEGLAGLVKNDKLGFADTSGKLVIPFKYFWSRPIFGVIPDYPLFSFGLIVVKDTIYRDRLDAVDVILDTATTGVTPGIAVVSRKNYGSKTGCINTRGELVIPMIYDFIDGFNNEGIACASLNDKLVLIDTLGNIVLEPKIEAHGSLFFQNGYSTFYTKEGRTGLIKLNGQIILEPRYDRVEEFSEGYAAVQISGDENGVKSGFIDTRGKFVFDRYFGFIKSFSEGFAAVEIDNKWGFINKEGKLVIKPKFNMVYEFNEGLAAAAVKQGKKLKYGFIDSTGKWVIQPVYNEAFYFSRGLAAVQIGRKHGFVDRTGKVVIKPKFDNAHRFRTELVGWAN